MYKKNSCWKKITLIFILISFSFYSIYQLINTKVIEIDKIYVLSLNRSSDRFKKIQEKLESMNLPVAYERFEAIDGNDIELMNIDTGERIRGADFASNTKLLKGKYEIICLPTWHGGFMPLNLNMTDFHPRVKGEIGCACSHRKIWDEILKKGYKNVLVLEDDIIFSPDFDKYLLRALNNVPKDYNFLYIGILDSRDSYQDNINNKWLKKIKRIIDRDLFNVFFKKVRRSVGSTESYIVSYKGAEILKENTTKYWHIDRKISNVIEDNKLNAYVIKPILTKQVGISTIGDFKDNDYETLKQEE